MLPVINGFCVEQAVKTGLGLNAQINHALGLRPEELLLCRPAGRLSDLAVSCSPSSARARSCSICRTARSREVGITRLHLEQDAGKSLHDQHPDQDLCRSQPLRRRADGDRLRAGHALVGGGGGLSAQAALDPALSRHLRRQHGRRQPALRRQRLGAPPGRGARHALRDQERQLDPLRPAGDRIRGAPPDRGDRGGRQDPAGDAAVRFRPRRHPDHAQQGRCARLPLFPRSGSAAAGARSRLGRAAEDDPAGAARRQEGPLHGGFRPIAL